MWLTHTMPARRRFTVRMARKMSRVQTAAASPVVDVVEDCRFDEQAAIEIGAARLSTADRELRLRFPNLLIGANAIELIAAHHWAHLRRAIEARTELDSLCLLDHCVDYVAVDGPLDEDAAAR